VKPASATKDKRVPPGPIVPEKPRWRQNVESIGLALLIALAVRSSVVQAFWVPSGSMLPTIQIGDHIFVNKLAYSIRLPLVGTELMRVGDLHRGDVIVFISPIDPSTDLIKRVIAVPGDTVEIRNKQLYVNGEKLPDPHAYFSDSTIMPSGHRDNMPPTQVPDGKFFVMGDNRDRSYDSRFWNFANVSDIKGKATFVYWSRDTTKGWSQIAQSIRFKRFGHFIE
jgi:signal peptidase I